MAATIKDNLGVVPNLKEGHGGIFEVAIGNRVVYTNHNECGHLPNNEEILQKIREYE